MSTQFDGAKTSAGQRLGRLAQNVKALLQLRLGEARRETQGTLRRLLVGAALALAALILALMALPLLAAAAILLLAQYMAAWLAAAIVLMTMLAGAGVLVVVARSRLRWKGPSLPQDVKSDWQAVRRRLEEEQ